MVALLQMGYGGMDAKIFVFSGCAAG